jgi:3alpha(or 20beta)-hydroxysteroid dehydrogenase
MGRGRLDGKVAIITGAARGQGAEEALLFAAEGACVVVADILEDAARGVVERIGDAAEFCPLDITRAEQWSAAMETCIKRFGPPTVLVNNAGILFHRRIEDCTEEEFRRVIDVNLIGAFLGIKAVIAPMAGAGGGSIVNTSSVRGLAGGAEKSAYSASKFALRGLTKSAAIELGPLGIRVNSIHPGAVYTPMVAPMIEIGDKPPDLSKVFANQPIQRIGRADEIAKMALFLASDDSSYSTGAEFVADGGSTAGG